MLPYIAQLPLVILNDLFIWKLGKKLVGVDATRFAMILIVFNWQQIEFISRCFTNSVEQILSVIAFYFYLKQGKSFTIDTVILTALITVSFVSRTTSIVGWIPLLAIKVLRDGSLIPFIMSAVTVAIPCMGLMFYIDSCYYGGEEWTVTSYNFLKTNVLEGLSRYFGEDPWFWYVLAMGPGIMLIVYPIVVYSSTVGHCK